jgi:cytochrome c oxidase assembly protein subunit 15
MTRLLAAGALLLMLAITTSSATVRLSLAGLGCGDWPACFDAARAAGGADVDVDVARGVHRLSASLAGVWVLVLLTLGWSVLRGTPQRVALAGLVALAGGLAALGVATPSPLPAVTLGNLVGGMTMVGLAAFLLGSCGRPVPGAATLPRRPSAAGSSGGTRAILLSVIVGLLLAQAVLGGLLGAHGAASRCPTLPGCGPGAWPAGVDWAVLAPFRATEVASTDARRLAALDALHVAHRIVGLAAVAAVLAFGWATWREPGIARAARAAGVVSAALAVVAAVLGGTMVARGYPLGAAVAHNALVACLVASLAWGAGAERARRAASGPA